MSQGLGIRIELLIILKSPQEEGDWGIFMDSRLITGLLLASQILGLMAHASLVEKAKLDVCLPEVCLSVEADEAEESSVDRTLVFKNSQVSYFHPETKKLFKKIKGSEVTWKPQLGFLWVKPTRGELERFDFKSPR